MTMAVIDNGPSNAFSEEAIKEMVNNNPRQGILVDGFLNTLVLLLGPCIIQCPNDFMTRGKKWGKNED